jgi:prophage regulatory protein
MIRLGEVCTMVGLSKAHVYTLINRGEFPKQIKIGPRCVRWSIAEIDDWLEKNNQQRAKATIEQQRIEYTPDAHGRLLRIGRVERMTGIDREHIQAMMIRGEFPEVVRIGKQYQGWREVDINAWVANQRGMPQAAAFEQPEGDAAKRRMTVVADVELAREVAAYRDQIEVMTGIQVSESQAICGLIRLGLKAAKKQ